ncbi:PepSY-associated TM helix domain-containing protein [Phenylobacterium sp. LjRoot219]|uniref:PepSY-associated TM helix domain-containing protein n=1 Tax=Phenylobacterium sp. LjRoot219 TaxID=3342283 RepID=UPI003ED05751
MEAPLDRAASKSARPAAASEPSAWRRRSFWLQQVRLWHWVSAALCLACMLLFAGTAITLNHADVFEPQPQTTSRTLQLPAALAAQLASGPSEGAAPLPAPVAAWVNAQLQFDLSGDLAEWSEDEVTAALPRPGGERALSFDRVSGALTYETSNRGVVGALNDLHTGRNSGRAWGWFIDVFAIGCLVFAATGLALACLYARGRPLTWPLLATGAGAPLILIILLLFHLL